MPRRAAWDAKPAEIGTSSWWLPDRVASPSHVSVRALWAELSERGISASPFGVACAEGGRVQLQKTLFASEQDRPSIARRRAQWRKYQGRLDPRRLVFIDESQQKATPSASSSFESTVERTSFGPIGVSVTKSRFFHFVTVLGFMP
ncbi:hypothetical protein JQK88_33000 [Mesorhizobium caraganae]|nr:hypothetical protein [Mesorhizobium caraganae]